MRKHTLIVDAAVVFCTLAAAMRPSVAAGDPKPPEPGPIAWGEAPAGDAAGPAWGLARADGERPAYALGDVIEFVLSARNPGKAPLTFQFGDRDLFLSAVTVEDAGGKPVNV